MDPNGVQPPSKPEVTGIGRVARRTETPSVEPTKINFGVDSELSVSAEAIEKGKAVDECVANLRMQIPRGVQSLIDRLPDVATGTPRAYSSRADRGLRAPK